MKNDQEKETKDKKESGKFHEKQQQQNTQNIISTKGLVRILYIP